MNLVRSQWPLTLYDLVYTCVRLHKFYLIQELRKMKLWTLPKRVLHPTD